MWPPSALLHAIPIAHSESSDPYIVIGLATLGVAVAIAAGLALGNLAQSGAARALAAAVAAGALVFLLYDLLKESASLGQGLSGSALLQLALLAAFALGLVGVAWLARGGDPSRLAWAWALGIAAHGMGEAWIVGTEALTADITAPGQAASFLLHKVIEGATIPLVVGAALPRARAWGIVAALSLLALVGGALGYATGPGDATTILFALGAGAAAFAILALARKTPLDARHAAAVAGGVALVYVAGLLHEIG